MTTAYQVQWSKCNVFDSNDEPTTYDRGALLPDGVDDIQLQHLSVIGAIRIVEVVPTEEEMRARMGTPVASQESSEGGSQDQLKKPTRNDDKQAWVDYASDVRNPNRISADQANSMSKTALMDKYQD